MAAIGFVLFIAFAACMIGTFGLLSNCLFEFGVEPAVKRCIAWRKACKNEKMVEIYVKDPTDAQIRIASRQERIHVDSLGLTSFYKQDEETLRALSKAGCFTYFVRKDAKLPDNFDGYYIPINERKETTMHYHVESITRIGLGGCECSNDIIFETKDRAEAKEFFARCVSDFYNDYGKEKETSGAGFNEDIVWEYLLVQLDEDSVYEILDAATYQYSDYLTDNSK